MPEPITLAPLDKILRRLETIEQNLALIEGILDLMQQRLVRIEALHPLHHYGVGRGGWPQEGP